MNGLIKIRNINTGEEETILTSGVFIFIGTEPNTEFLETYMMPQGGLA